MLPPVLTSVLRNSNHGVGRDDVSDGARALQGELAIGVLGLRAAGFGRVQGFGVGQGKFVGDRAQRVAAGLLYVCREGPLAQ